MKVGIPIALLLFVASASAEPPARTVSIPVARGVLRPDLPEAVRVVRKQLDGRLRLEIHGKASEAVRAELEAEATRLGHPARVESIARVDIGPIVTPEEWPKTPDARTDPWFQRTLMDALLGDLRPEIEREALAGAERDRRRLATLGSIESRPGLTILRIRGGPYAMGLQHGTLLRERIRALLAELRTEEGILDELRMARGLLPGIPGVLVREIRGIANGAGIPFDEALLLSTLGGVSGRAHVRWEPEPVMYASLGGRRAALLGRYVIATASRPSGGYAFVTVGWAGSVGAAVALTERDLALIVARQDGANPSLVVPRLRHAAQFARDPGDAAEALRDLVVDAGFHVLWPGRDGGRNPEADATPLRLADLLAHAPVPLPAPYDVPLNPQALSIRFEPGRSFANCCRVLSLTFRSPIVSGDARNDLVPADLYEPSSGAVRGAVILLPIWRGGGPFLERYVAAHLVRRGFATFILPLPYQFGRAPAGVRSGALTITEDIGHDREVMLQAVSDARWARHWLRARGYAEDRITIMGISLGGHVAALAHGVDPGFASGAFVLMGGDVASLLWNDSRDTRWLKRRLRERGVTLAEVREACRDFEPLRYARPWRGSGVVLAAARRDATVPPTNVRALRAALGGPPILWVDATHTSGLLRLPHIIRFLADALTDISVQGSAPRGR